MNDFDLTGRRVLVTGGGDGLGRQFVTALVEAGAEAVICGRREAPLQETREALTAAGARVDVVVADVTNDDDRVRLASAAGDIDVLVNNAGVSSRARWDAVALDDWRYIMNLNVEAPFRLVQLLAPGMVERGFGRIINISSIYGLVAGDPSRYPGHGLDIGSYFTSKHALIGLTKTLAVDLGGTGVTVNALCPGMFPSPANDEVLTPAVAAALEGGTPVGRLGNDRDLRTAILYLAAPGSSFVTGQSVVVDGGWTIW